jgi:hypothetical protein
MERKIFVSCDHRGGEKGAVWGPPRDICGRNRGGGNVARPLRVGCSSESREAFAPELIAAIRSRQWAGVYVVADSDAETNPHVASAMTTLARAIRMQCGIRAKYVALPSLEEVSKCGLDDFLVYRSVDEFEEKVLIKAKEPEPGFRYIVPYRVFRGDNFERTLNYYVPYYYGDEEAFDGSSCRYNYY